MSEWVNVCTNLGKQFYNNYCYISHFTHFYCVMVVHECINCFNARNANHKTNRPTNDIIREKEKSILSKQGFFQLSYPFYLSISLLRGRFNFGPLFSTCIYFLFRPNLINFHIGYCLTRNTFMKKVIIFNKTEKKLPSNSRFFVRLFGLLRQSVIYKHYEKWQDTNERHCLPIFFRHKITTVFLLIVVISQIMRYYYVNCF